jgi:hypothetical protein
MMKKIFSLLCITYVQIIFAAKVESPLSGSASSSFGSKSPLLSYPAKSSLSPNQGRKKAPVSSFRFSPPRDQFILPSHRVSALSQSINNQFPQGKINKNKEPVEATERLKQLIVKNPNLDVLELPPEDFKSGSQNMSPPSTGSSLDPKALHQALNALVPKSNKFDELKRLYAIIKRLDIDSNGDRIRIENWLSDEENKKSYDQGVKLFRYYRQNPPKNQIEKETYDLFFTLANKLFPPKSPQQNNKKISSKKTKFRYIRSLFSSKGK